MNPNSSAFDNCGQSSSEPRPSNPERLLPRAILNKLLPEPICGCANYFDAVIFAGTNDELDMDASQKQDLMSFIKEDSKGFVCIYQRGPGLPRVQRRPNVRRRWF
jgi:hypothetical protein